MKAGPRTFPDTLRDSISTVVVSGLLVLGHTSLAQADDLSALFTDAKPILDIRLRYEHVDQAGFDQTANAVTLRTQAGFETGSYKGVSFLFEAENILNLGLGNFNDTENGRVSFPVVADPETTEINQLNVAWQPDERWTVRLGRQEIVRDDSRFVGDVIFRQNQQTYDAVWAEYKPSEASSLAYFYANQVNRIFGDGNPAGRFNGNIHYAEAVFSPSEGFTFKPFVLSLGIREVPTLSTRTIGLRTNADLGPVRLNIDVAQQRDSRRNPVGADLLYGKAEAVVPWKAWRFSAGWEVFEGNGALGFATPLATLHKFNGFADAFLTTPADGLQDRYISARVGLGDWGPFGNVALQAWYHDFATERQRRSLGEEMDVRLTARFQDWLNVELKYADLSGTPEVAGRQKLWFFLTYRY